MAALRQLVQSSGMRDNTLNHTLRRAHLQQARKNQQNMHRHGKHPGTHKPTLTHNGTQRPNTEYLAHGPCQISHVLPPQIMEVSPGGQDAANKAWEDRRESRPPQTFTLPRRAQLNSPHGPNTTKPIILKPDFGAGVPRTPARPLRTFTCSRRGRI